MSHDEKNRTDRRTFLQAGAAATASAVSLASRADRPGVPAEGRGGGRGAAQAEAGQDRYRGDAPRAGGPRRDTERVLRFAFARGIRLFDYRQAVRHRAQLQEVVRTGPRDPQADRPGHQGQAPRALRPADDGRPAAGDPRDRLHRPLLHPWAGRRLLWRDRQVGRSSSRAASSGRWPTRSATRARRSSSGSRRIIPSEPGSSRRRPRTAYRRDHAPVSPLAGQGFAAQQGDRRGLEQGDRPDLDEADRQPGLRRQAQGGHPQGGQAAGAGAGRAEADALPGPAALRSGPTSGSAPAASR